MRKLIKVVGYGLFTLAFIGLWLTVIASVRAGQPFYGVNYKHLALGTYSTLAALIMITIILAIVAGARLRQLMKKPRKPL